MSSRLDFGAFHSALTLRHFCEVRLVYYSDWKDIQALRRLITEVIVIALKLSWGPKGLIEKTLRP